MKSYARTVLEIEKRKVETDVENIELQKELLPMSASNERMQMIGMQNILNKRIEELAEAIRKMEV